MDFERVILEISDDHVARITLNRPDRMNTFDSVMADELYRALVAADEDEKVRAVLIRGAGKAFCAGIDVNELEGKSTQEYREWIELMERPLVTISRMRNPVVSQVQGVAAANGMGLVAASDLAVAAENVRMGLTAINVGLNCVGPVVPVARCVGRKKALELLFFGKLIPASEALSLGLVNKLAPKDRLEEETEKWVAELVRKSPLALRNAKTAFYNSEDMAYEKQFAHMNEAFARLCSCDDAKEGVKAFFEKRPPEWKLR